MVHQVVGYKTMECTAAHTLALQVGTYGTRASRGLEDSFVLVLGVYSEYKQAC